jgi:archaellum component FlaG (FlaF/FlaG flagellin family)
MTKSNLVFIIAALVIAPTAFATGVMSPSSTSSVEDLWNAMFGNTTSFSNIALMIKGVCSSIVFFFAAWCAHGLYQGALADKTIPRKEAFILFIRLNVFLTCAIYIFTR